MDLRNLSQRIADHKEVNAVWTFEGGEAVRRTFDVVCRDVERARERLNRCGVEPGMRVGIRSQNCYDWLIYDLALIDLRAVCVAFTNDFAQFTAQELCEKYALALLLLDPKDNGKATDLDPVLYFGNDNAEVRARSEAPKTSDPEFDRPGLIFSSGSEGGLKGLILDRRGIEACIDAFTDAVRPLRDDRLLIFLPISNFQQRLMYYAAFWRGFDVVVIEPVYLFRAFQELVPTLLIAPPAFYETFESRFYNLPETKRRIVQMIGATISVIPFPALRRRVAQLIFRDAYQMLGGKMRFMVTGMAPIKRSTLDFFSMMQMPLFETYGLIESGTVSLNLPGARRIRSVGRPLPGVRVELTPENEIVVYRDHPISVGYFECSEGEDKRTFIGGGAIATGDVGRIDADGFLYLVGRKKEIIVTGGGEKIHPEVIEARINACPEVERAVVFSRENLPTLAVVVLPKRIDDPKSHARIQRFVDDINRAWRNVNIAKVIFTDHPFSRENGFLRPNLKLDRKRIGQHFGEAIWTEGSKFANTAE